MDVQRSSLKACAKCGEENRWSGGQSIPAGAGAGAGAAEHTKGKLSALKVFLCCKKQE